MTLKHFVTILLITLLSSSLFSQTYERYKKLEDISIQSKNLGFEKKISITVPVEWQRNVDKKFPLIIIFDKQNARSHNYIINAIDYLTGNEQMPSSVIVSVNSDQEHRYQETQYKISDSSGLAAENEAFIFNELIPLMEKDYKASNFRLLIGHSRYGYLTSSIFCTKTNAINAVIAMSPFFSQKNTNLTQSINNLKNQTFANKKYFRFGIGNDYPDDYRIMDSIIKIANLPSNVDIKGSYFKEATHNATPGLLITIALYEIFEKWNTIQVKYLSKSQTDLGIKAALSKQIVENYGTDINFSLGILNGKGWEFYNDKQYAKAIQAWKILLDTYPNFSEAYLYIIDAKIQLKENYQEDIALFQKSLSNSEFYKNAEKEEFQKELQDLIK
jgi:predicted alpha/beta superfamily hydrolase